MLRWSRQFILVALTAVCALDFSAHAQIAPQALSAATIERLDRVPEFAFIRELAQRYRIRAYLFGGTAAAFGHYVRWDLEREAGDDKYQPERFDYDFTNIYRGNQDLDIVIDADAATAQKFAAELQRTFPHFQGDKEAWEVRLLRQSTGEKSPLLNDYDFLNQHTDSNSTGLIDVTQLDPSQQAYFDLRNWENPNSQFLTDVASGSITYYHSRSHETTTLYKKGMNPPILSAVRYLAKLAQYDVVGRPEDLQKVTAIVAETNFASLTSYAKEKAAQFSLKALLNSPDVEYAWNLLDDVGLREKLIEWDKAQINTVGSLAWWMSKEPLRSFVVGRGDGKTARELGIMAIAHETSDVQAYESITRSRRGTPNVFISRSGIAGEGAHFGAGFYTLTGKKGAAHTGITVRFEVNPEARSNSDFSQAGSILIMRNKNAFRVVPENLFPNTVSYFEFLDQGKKVSNDDQALLFRFKQKLSRSMTAGIVPLKEMAEIRAIVLEQFKGNSVNRNVIIHEWLNLEGTVLKRDPKTIEFLAASLTSGAYRADPAPLFDGLTDLSKNTSLEPFVERELLPVVLAKLNVDIGDRALEHCLFSKVPSMRAFGEKVLAARDTGNATPFVRALKSIDKHGGDAEGRLESATHTIEVAQEKAAYLALHPEFRRILSAHQWSLIGPEFNKLTNISVFEQLAAKNGYSETLLATMRSESFQFIVFDNVEMQGTPVTQLQWLIVTGKNPSWSKSDDSLNRPVEQVSAADDIPKFIQKLNEVDPAFDYRLPTDAEWNSASVEMNAKLNNSNVTRHSSDVASHKPNRAGFYDMDGHFWEWTVDDGAPPKIPYRPGLILESWQYGADHGPSRIVRRGPVGDSISSSSGRGYYSPSVRNGGVGFRLVRTPKPSRQITNNCSDLLTGVGRS